MTKDNLWKKICETSNDKLDFLLSIVLEELKQQEQARLTLKSKFQTLLIALIAPIAASISISSNNLNYLIAASGAIWFICFCVCFCFIYSNKFATAFGTFSENDVSDLVENEESLKYLKKMKLFNFEETIIERRKSNRRSSIAFNLCLIASSLSLFICATSGVFNL